MKKAYLLLIENYDANDIYINHEQKCFVINYHNNKIVLKLEEVKDFLPKFTEDLNNLIKI